MRRLSRNASTLSIIAALAFSPACIVVAGSGAGDSNTPGSAKANNAPQGAPKPAGDSATDSPDTPAPTDGGDAADTPADPASGSNSTTQPGKPGATPDAQPGKTGVMEMSPSTNPGTAPDQSGPATKTIESNQRAVKKADQSSTTLSAKPN